MNMNKYLDIAPEVQQALADGRPVVALESTIISHGMPYPKNVETALLVEQTPHPDASAGRPGRTQGRQGSRRSRTGRQDDGHSRPAEGTV